MPLESLNIPAEVLAEAEALTRSGYNLEVPVVAETNRNKGWARWDEYATVESAYRESVPKDGQNIVSFVIRTKVIPFGDSPNGGRANMDFNRINYSALAGDSAVPAANLEGQKKMSFITIRKLKQLAVLADFDLTSGITTEILSSLFPVQGTPEDMTAESPLIGMKVTMTVTDNSGKKRNGANTQNVDGYAPAPEGM